MRAFACVGGGFSGGGSFDPERVASGPKTG